MNWVLITSEIKNLSTRLMMLKMKIVFDYSVITSSDLYLQRRTYQEDIGKQDNTLPKGLRLHQTHTQNQENLVILYASKMEK